MSGWWRFLPMITITSASAITLTSLCNVVVFTNASVAGTVARCPWCDYEADSDDDGEVDESAFEPVEWIPGVGLVDKGSK